MKDKIKNAADSPRDLEAIYRTDPTEFTRVFPDVFTELPDSTVLKVWSERLFFKETEGTNPLPTSGFRSFDIWLTFALAMIAGTLVKLPQFFPAINNERFYSRNLGGIIIGALFVYFCAQKPCRIRVTVTLVTLFLGGLIFLNLLPDLKDSQTVVLSCLHLPFFFWSVLGIAFMGGNWRDPNGRMDYLRYNGELVVYSTVVLIGGMILTGLTIALFKLIDLNIGDWYMTHVVVYGSTAAPVVATFLLDRIVVDRFKIAPILAKVFTPLFFLTVVAYLIAMIFNQRSPFTDREFLIAFNGLLLLVLALCVFSISERKHGQMVDILNMGLVAITLIIDIVALSAILFRLTSYGFTPNRVAVLGANLLAFGHLAGILWHYARFAARKASIECLNRWIVHYLPAYTTWSLIVATGFPLIFWFR